MNKSAALAVMLIGAFLGCDDGDLGPGDSAVTNVQVSFSTQRGASPFAISRSALADTLVTGSDTLIITSAEMILKEIELKRAEVTSCDTLSTTNDCEEFEAGPFLVDLPVDGSTVSTFALDIPTGVYDEIEFTVHKVDGDDEDDSTFVAQHPEFDKLSIRVRGSFNGQAFEYTTDLNAEQEIDLTPPLTITEDSQPTNLTVLVELATWFRDQSGGLVDPESGNKGEVNEGLIKENIKQSFEAFEDDDGDGRPSS